MRYDEWLAEIDARIARRDRFMAALPKCPRCKKGHLVHAAIGEPQQFSCGHLDYTVDLVARPVSS